MCASHTDYGVNDFYTTIYCLSPFFYGSIFSTVQKYYTGFEIVFDLVFEILFFKKKTKKQEVAKNCLFRIYIPDKRHFSFF